ncbi:phage tail protein [Gallibacterium anatis]|uniref:phage tail-collar fiber domain-containing protein n=1 Tax=Gallibacterium anatis TaxID=750 RepID=UPI00254EF303|nr:phage tail protein [Gallibacterium anatis]WIM82935.1 phage tail protein [Gallibacterium anatis]
MASKLTQAFETYIRDSVINHTPVVFDEFIFANIPGLNDDNLDSHLTIPQANQIVHRQAVSQIGALNENAIVYSVTIGTEIGDFDFNWVGLVNKSQNLLACGIFSGLTSKVKNREQKQGNSITRSVLLEFPRAQELANVSVSAETWQIDFTMRLSGIDEKIRLTNRDLYGRAVFFDNAFLLKRKSGNVYTLDSGYAYIEGVRAEIKRTAEVTVPTLPASVYVDICHHATVTGAYQTEIKYLTKSKNDYVGSDGYQHYVQIIADIASNGTITDRRLTDNAPPYIAESKKSSSVSSTSEKTVATSKAVKTAYDKAVDANNNADSRVSKSGGEMTGGLKLKANYGVSEKKWDYSGFYAGSATLNDENLPYFQIHIGSYSGNQASCSKSLGFDLSGYNAYVMSWGSNGNYLGKKEILTELHCSDSVTSASSGTVATSKAVKTAYDKAVEGVNKAQNAQTAARNAQQSATNADNNANNRVAKTGDTVTGTLYLKQGSKKYNINGWNWSLLLEIDSNLDSLIGNNRCAIGFNNSGSLGLGGNAVDGWWAGINKSGLSVAKEITEGLTGKKLSESLPIPWLVGVPLPWMQSAVPAGFLAMQGQAFDKSRYPILAQRYPNGRLPDLRGEFIRGWDNGRGVDSGRSLLSNQGDAIRNISGSITNITSEGGIGVSGVFSSSYSSGGRAAGGGAGRSTAYFDVSRVVPTASENRPRNIAYQYICLAA